MVFRGTSIRPDGAGSVCQYRIGVGHHGCVQRDGLYRVSAKSRDCYSHGPWCATAGRLANGSKEWPSLNNRRCACRHNRQPGLDASYRQPNLGCFGHGSVDFFGGCAGDFCGGPGSMLVSGAPGYTGEPTDCLALRVTLRSFACLGSSLAQWGQQAYQRGCNAAACVEPGERVPVCKVPHVDCVSLKRMVVPARRKRSGSVAEHGADAAVKTVYGSPSSLSL